jgi:hypothetical protein
MEPDNLRTTSIDTLPLVNAVLCADCEMISNSRGDSCVVCGSRSLLNLSRILGGSAGKIRAALVGETGELRNSFTVLINAEAPHVLRQRRRRKPPSLLEKAGR